MQYWAPDINPFLLQFKFKERQVRTGYGIFLTVMAGPGRAFTQGTFYSRTSGYRKRADQAFCSPEDAPCFGTITVAPGARTEKVVAITIFAEGGITLFNASWYPHIFP